MVNAQLILELEQGGMEYRDAFKVANLMDTEGMSRKEAIKKVTQDKEASEKAELQKLKDENKEKAKIK